MLYVAIWLVYPLNQVRFSLWNDSQVRIKQLIRHVENGHVEGLDWKRVENHKRHLKRLGESLACPPSFKEMRDGSRLFYSFVQLMKISKNNTGIGLYRQLTVHNLNKTMASMPLMSSYPKVSQELTFHCKLVINHLWENASNMKISALVTHN